jgi:hypothetical protein
MSTNKHKKYLISAPQTPFTKKRDKKGHQKWVAGMCCGYMERVYVMGIMEG